MTSASVYLSWPEDFKLPLSSLISLPPMNCLTMIELTRSTLVFGFEMVLACFCLKKANIVTLWYPSVGTPFAVSEFSHCSQVLSRHQFLEMLLRVADQRYVQTGPAAECCRSTWTVQWFPQGHGPFFWWNMGLQTDEHWRYMDIFRLTLNGNGYIGTFPSLLGPRDPRV